MLFLSIVAFGGSCIKDREMLPRYGAKVELAALAGAQNIAGKTDRQTDRQTDREAKTVSVLESLT